MRKYTLVLILICLLILVGCGSSVKSQYDESTNQRDSIFGISFQIPAEWNEKYSGEDYLQFYDGKSDSFDHGIYFSENNGGTLDECTEIIRENLEIYSEENNDMSNIDFHRESIANMPAGVIEYTRKCNGKEYRYVIVLFQKNDDTIQIEFSSVDKTGIDDFSKVIDSITINNP